MGKENNNMTRVGCSGLWDPFTMPLNKGPTDANFTSQGLKKANIFYSREGKQNFKYFYKTKTPVKTEFLQCL